MFRFTIRELVLLTLVVAMALAVSMKWWADSREILAQQRAHRYWKLAALSAKEEMEKDGRRVEFVEGLGIEVDGRLVLLGHWSYRQHVKRGQQDEHNGEHDRHNCPTSSLSRLVVHAGIVVRPVT